MLVQQALCKSHVQACPVVGACEHFHQFLVGEPEQRMVLPYCLRVLDRHGINERMRTVEVGEVEHYVKILLRLPDHRCVERMHVGMHGCADTSRCEFGDKVHGFDFRGETMEGAQRHGGGRERVREGG